MGACSTVNHPILPDDRLYDIPSLFHEGQDRLGNNWPQKLDSEDESDNHLADLLEMERLPPEQSSPVLFSDQEKV
jgi:hypothetical protein